MPTEDKYKKLEEEINKSNRFTELKKDLKRIKGAMAKGKHDDIDYFTQEKDEGLIKRAERCALVATAYANEKKYGPASGYYYRFFGEICSNRHHGSIKSFFDKTQINQVLKLLKHVERDAFNYAKKANKDGDYKSAEDLLYRAKKAKELLDAYEKPMKDKKK